MLYSSSSISFPLNFIQKMKVPISIDNNLMQDNFFEQLFMISQIRVRNRELLNYVHLFV